MIKNWIATALCVLTVCLPNANSGKGIETGAVQIPNPFVDCETPDAAAKLAGFDLTVSEEPVGFSDRKIQAIENDLIQVIYDSEDGQTVMIRKAVGKDDISGDYSAHAETNTVTVGRRQVTMKGANGMATTAIWVDGGYAYSVYADQAGLTSEAMRQLVSGIH